MSSCDWPYLIAPRDTCAVLQLRKSVSVFNGAAGPSDASHALKSRFIPYLNTIEQFASLPRALSAPEQVFHSMKLFFAIRVEHARNIGGIDDGRALLLQHVDGVGHHLELIGVEAAARFGRSRRRRLRVKERARDADARALQPVGLQVQRVIAIRRRRAPAASRNRWDRARRPRARRAGSRRRLTNFAIGPAVSWSAVIGITP